MLPFFVMIQSLKNIVHKVLGFLLLPVRMAYRKRNGTGSVAHSMELPNHILLGAVRDAVREGHTATIIVKGWSMRPFVEHKRDKVLLDSAENVEVYDAVLAEIEPGRFVLHRIIDIEPDAEDRQQDRITLMGDGNIRGTEQCRRKDLCGKVVQYIRPQRTISADDPTLRRRIRMWKRLLPIRRYLLVIYKAIVQ